MKILNYQDNKKKSDAKGFAGLMEQLGNLLGGEPGTSKAQDNVVEHLQKVLDNSYTVLLNYPLPKVGIDIPMLLIGPPGVRVLYPFGKRGLFRAKEDTWMEMNDRKRKFELAKQNLVGLTSNLALAVHKYMEENGVNLHEIEPIMIFSDPGTHIDTVRPLVRIVPTDAIEKFASSLLQIPATLNNEDVYSLSALITRPPVIASPGTDESGSQPFDFGEEGAAGWMEQQGTGDNQDGQKSGSSGTPEALFGLGFSLNQWIIIGVLFAGIIMAFFGFALVLIFF